MSIDEGQVGCKVGRGGAGRKPIADPEHHRRHRHYQSPVMVAIIDITIAFIDIVGIIDINQPSPALTAMHATAARVLYPFFVLVHEDALGVGQVFAPPRVHTPRPLGASPGFADEVRGPHLGSLALATVKVAPCNLDTHTYRETMLTCNATPMGHGKQMYVCLFHNGTRHKNTPCPL